MKTIDDPTNARSRRTREALLQAARELIEDEGFDALTMGEVATRAGVTRRAVYLHFASRADLVTALFEHIATTEGLHESLRPVWEAEDSVAALHEWARHLARYHPRVMGVGRAVQRVQGSDQDARRHRDKVGRAQREGCRRLATRLAREGRLRAPWTVDSASDMLWALISTDMVERLLHSCRWSQQRLAEALGELFVATFVEPAAE